MCRQTYLSPTYGSPLQKLLMLPAIGAEDGQRFMAFMLEDKIGVIKLPLTGNPHLASALIVHPQGVSDIACSHDGKYLFSVGGQDLTVNMWRINTPVLDAQEKLGGDGLEPFFGLLDGGRNGNLFREMEDYFYYAQIRSQGMEVMEMRHVSERIPLSEVPFIMRALGYYPTEQEIEEILNEVKFSRYVETGECRTDIDLPDFIRLFVNHKPAFGLQPELIRWAFDALGGSVDRDELLHLLQTRGEKMTEDELAEHLTTLLGVSMEGASSATLGPLDEHAAANLLETQLPETIDADVFIHKITGFSARRPDGAGAADGDTPVDPRPTSSDMVAPQA